MSKPEDSTLYLTGRSRTTLLVKRSLFEASRLRAAEVGSSTPSHFKNVDRFRSVRVGLRYRALAVESDEGLFGSGSVRMPTMAR